MRTRILAVTALVTLSSVLSGQVGRRPPVGGGRTTDKPGAAPLPKEAPDVSRALRQKRSRWSTEAYTVISAVRAPTGSGDIVTSTSYGTGTHADYRFADHLSFSIDGTYAPLGYQSTVSSVEMGSRYSPFSWEHKSRPFFDLRGGYTYLLDHIPTANPAAFQGGLEQASRYSRGFGALAGAGLEYSITGSFMLVTELAATRNRMTLTQSDGPAVIGSQSKFWMTGYRAVIGLKYNPLHALYLAQNPRQ